MKTDRFPLVVTEKGVSAKIRRAFQTKRGTKYAAFVVEFTLLGKRKRVWRSNLDDAKAFAKDACIKVANGAQSALELPERDRLACIRAKEILSPVHVSVDIACQSRYFVAADFGFDTGAQLE